ncbi:MAG TPA: hypothetical protein ENG51_09345 [Deltaproteobacteria bacterium]|nr:hypothetical protein [Deltaproteobacteria bacterium]
MRKCLYKEKQYYFHGWFQQGWWEPNIYSDFQEGSLDVVAILEDCDGKVIRTTDIENIKFIKEESNNE